jgi:putative nucleotidyltransferase with HDIG domain
VPAEPSRAYRAYCASLLACTVGLTAALALTQPLHFNVTTGIILAFCALTLMRGVVLDDERSALSLTHLPLLASAFLLSPVLVPVVAAGMTAIDTRTFGRWSIMGNAGGVALAAGAAMGVSRALAPADPVHPLWFFAAVAGAVAFFVTNHALASLITALRCGDSPLHVWRAHFRPMVGGDLLGSTILIGFVGLMAGVPSTTLKVVTALVALLCVTLLLLLLARTRERVEALAQREEAVAGREEALAQREMALEAAREASSLAAQAQAEMGAAVNRLHDLANATVPGLVRFIDLRDRYTARHSASVAVLCRMLAAELDWSKEDQALAHVAGLVHDIGKVGMPDAILGKHGPPTEEEWVEIRRHPDEGADVLSGMGLMSLFPSVVEAVRSHHERWDGSGYPNALEGARIPELARLVAIADSYDTMVTPRYAMPAKRGSAARAELAREAGRLYDRRMVGAFLAALGRMGDQTRALRSDDFAAEWRKASEGLDLERLYLPPSPPAPPTASGTSARPRVAAAA